jgi:hypothetical protein
MKAWDLNAGIGKLKLSLESLNEASANAQQYWNDEAYCRLQETYIAPVDPKVRNLLDALQRLGEVLNSAERECGMN